MLIVKPSVNRVLKAAIEHLEEEGELVTPQTQYLVVSDWYNTWRKLARTPDDFKLLLALERAEIRLFNTNMNPH